MHQLWAKYQRWPLWRRQGWVWDYQAQGPAWPATWPWDACVQLEWRAQARAPSPSTLQASLEAGVTKRGTWVGSLDGLPLLPGRCWWPATSPRLEEGLWGCVGGTQLAGQCSGTVNVGARGDTGPEGRGAQGDMGLKWFVTEQPRVLKKGPPEDKGSQMG
jgi:hypothetical protein